MSLGFNASSKKEDVSLKLRAQNFKDARDMTRRLENESDRMEARLRELKVAMRKEKEKRETNGTYWKTGERGSLGKEYTTRVLAKPEKKPRRIRVLKEEPISSRPQQNPAPGTMAHIAQQNPADQPQPVTSARTVKCGQCETKLAAVTCVECGEDFCASCFAAFHLKGALRKHRSVPVSTRNTPRVAMSPRPVTPLKSARSSARVKFSTSDSEPENQESSLLDGEFDEEANAREFREALNNWRNEKKNPPSQKQEATVKKQATLRAVTPTVQTDMYTETVTDVKPVEIEFKNSGLSYAERLMLKRHRRRELQPLPDDVSSPNTDESRSVSTPDTARSFSHNREAVGEEDRIAFESLYEAAVGKPVQSDTPESRPVSSLSIIELDNDTPSRRLRGIEKTSKYIVEEEPDLLEAASDRIRQGLRTEEEAFLKTRHAFTKEEKVKNSKLAKSKRKASKKDDIRDIDMSASLDLDVKSAKDININSKISRANIRPQSGMKDKVQKNEKRLSQTPRAKDVKSKATPRNTPGSRPGTATGSRPQSRAQSRAGQRPRSRAEIAFDVYGEGTLTKEPSSALEALAERCSSAASNISAGFLPEPVNLSYRGLGDYFTGGVALPAEERVITPSQDRPSKSRVSNRTYSMAPRSWRPDKTDADTVDDLVVRAHYKDYLPPPSPPQIQTTSFALSEQHENFFEKSEKSRNKKHNIVLQERVESALSAMQAVVDTDSIDANPDDTRSLSPNAPLDQTPPQPATVPPFDSRPSTARPDSARPGSARPGSSARVLIVNPHRLAAENTPSPPTTPRLSSRLRSARKSKVRASYNRPPTRSGRESSMIVVDGDDMTRYDDDTVNQHQQQHEDEQEALGQLEWELASQAGTLNADGTVSRMSLMLSDEDSCDSIDLEAVTGRRDDGVDITKQFCGDELDVEEDDNDEEDVAALLD